MISVYVFGETNFPAFVNFLNGRSRPKRMRIFNGALLSDSHEVSITELQQ